ncbi:hypothetical protein SBA3_3640009 [Candidatus Sulfopaludibacter sp. SbA3]|nr:hypothetical protein SBA3_3640009 [Candidatus Sulfopaludibacter sp. SbA3]
MVYKVEFEIPNGSAGEAQPRQHFSMLVDEARKGVFQAAKRVPVAAGSPQYVDVGVNIECAVQESGGKAALHGEIELSGITGYSNISSISEPIVGQRKMAFNTTVELGTRTVIIDDPKAPSADPASAATRQVVATVTKVN